MSDDPWERRSLTDYEHVAEIAAQKAVAHTFSALGIDISRQSELNDLRDVLLHARKIQKLSERVGMLAVVTLCTAVMSGAVAFMWKGFVTALGR